MSLQEIKTDPTHFVSLLTKYLNTTKKVDTFLFCGPEGSGKSYFARHFAQDYLCDSPIDGFACKKCPSCRYFDKNTTPAFKEINQHGETIKIGTIREIHNYCLLQPVFSSCKIVLIHHADTLTMEASNAMLKVLEEPNHSTCFVLLSDRPEKLIDTIKSRAICIRFKPYSDDTILSILADYTSSSDRKLLASIAFGNCDRAIRLCEPDFFQQRSDNCSQFLSLLLDRSSILTFPSKIMNEQMKLFIFESQMILRDVLCLMSGNDTVKNFDLLPSLKKISEMFEMKEILYFMHVLIQAEKHANDVTINPIRLAQKISFDCKVPTTTAH